VTAPFARYAMLQSVVPGGNYSQLAGRGSVWRPKASVTRDGSGTRDWPRAREGVGAVIAPFARYAMLQSVVPGGNYSQPAGRGSVWCATMVSWVTAEAIRGRCRLPGGRRH
jgi:hypothetical protein